MYARQGRLIHVEGNPDSPVNAGTLCPKGATLFSLHANPNRLTRVKHRAPYATRWEEKPLDWAMDRIAALAQQTRDETFVEARPDETTSHHTPAITPPGGAPSATEQNRTKPLR